MPFIARFKILRRTKKQTIIVFLSFLHFLVPLTITFIFHFDFELFNRTEELEEAKKKLVGRLQESEEQVEAAQGESRVLN